MSGTHTYPYLSLPDSTTDMQHYADVCASACIRVHGEGVELIEVDVTSPYLAGTADGVVNKETHPGKCKCMAHTDTTDGTADTTPSRTSPADASLLQWLSTGTMEADPSLRPMIGIYAVHRRLWKWKWIENLQSSIFYARSLEPNHYLDYTLSPANTLKLSDHNVQTVEECLVECSKAHGRVVKGIAVDDTKPGQECNCFSVPLTDPSLDTLWRLRRDGQAGSNFQPYDVQFCQDEGRERKVRHLQEEHGRCLQGDPISGMTIQAPSLLSGGPFRIQRSFRPPLQVLCDAEPSATSPTP